MPSAIVIGAGVFGASAADRLARDGWEVTLVDRLEPGHPRSESGGETRLMRCSHGPDAYYTRSARRAWELWRELGQGVLVDPGVVWFARQENGWEADSERTLREARIPVERLEPGDAARFYPSLAVDDLAFVLHEPEAGVLKASEGVRALVRRARDAGAVLTLAPARPAASAVDIDGRRHEADAVVWACGAWLAQLFPDLVKLRVTFQQLSLFDAAPEWSGPGWVDFDAATYGHALIEPFGFKAASDLDGPDIDPDERALEAGENADHGRTRVPRAPLPGPGRRAGEERARLPLQLHRGRPVHLRSPSRARATSGYWAAARDTASSTARRWPSTWRRCWPARPSPSRASHSASARARAACGRPASAPPRTRGLMWLWSFVDRPGAARAAGCRGRRLLTAATRGGRGRVVRLCHVAETRFRATVLDWCRTATSRQDSSKRGGPIRLPDGLVLQRGRVPGPGCCS